MTNFVRLARHLSPRLFRPRSYSPSLGCLSAVTPSSNSPHARSLCSGLHDRDAPVPKRILSRLSAARDTALQSPWGRLMRLDKPIGTRLLFLPTAWGITLGAPGIGDAVALYALTYAGAVVMRGAGCTINDLWDEDIDRNVKRTRSRPITSGEVSVPAGFVFLATQLCVGLGVLLSLNDFAILVGAPSVIPVIFYPLAKRATDYPQAVLGLTFNWGVPVGYAAAAGALAPEVWMLYGAGWCWTMVYDTIYAHQDKKDDVRVGVRSSALALGGNTRVALAGLTAAKVGLLAAAGATAGLSAPYFWGISLAGAHTAKQVLFTDFSDPKQCGAAFLSNDITGAITLAALIAGRLF